MSQADLFASDLPPEPDRESGLKRVEAFAASMGRAYASKRNFDFGPQDRSNISCLSPHIRHRLVLESELAQAALSAHGSEGAEKFIQEVCWRTYWKGWLEMRPSVWSDYKAELADALNVLAEDGVLRQRYATAIEGRTGIACFDAWTAELIETGYLHNHARMWFASIWIFTLDLPWVLGADFFLRHLMDGDPASNTLGWRWVGGLQTVGKTYLARASNIEKFTEGRFAPDPQSLASSAPPLPVHRPAPEPSAIVPGDRWTEGRPAVLWLHEDDLHPESWGLGAADIRCVVFRPDPVSRGASKPGEVAWRFATQALEDGAQRASNLWGVQALACQDASDMIAAAHQNGATHVVTQRPFQGPVADHAQPVQEALEASGLRVARLTRDWDQAFHPYATKGFFKFKTAIPDVFERLGLS
ncbi:FAD-binding domain-containing protein [Oceanicaulis sp. MMSF_3324]|uniref:FAD-binding domain-containing protein n=1 Tax=Oceanicaulis sp. MMSF_3324 TaxID=3046702 RepID=UPI00273DE191|nr:FAD-binding domain-containing protein [Oceanicaulis sp. MMSF_3324]